MQTKTALSAKRQFLLEMFLCISINALHIIEERNKKEVYRLRVSHVLVYNNMIYAKFEDFMKKYLNIDEELRILKSVNKRPAKSRS